MAEPRNTEAGNARAPRPAAAALFVGHGLAAATNRQIAERVGIR